MAEGYQALYRRYRSKQFGELRGQDHVTRTLRNEVRDGRVTHAYLFSGPRGTGKTSTARILAKVLNCEHPVDGEPDGTCPNCIAVDEGRIVDWLLELDAASNNGVANIRELIVHAQVLTPKDIEEQFGLSEGNIFQGELSLEQLFFNRPVPGWARYRTPLRNLWMCGSATHPGGGIMGASGRLAALQVVRSLRGGKVA